MSEPCVILQQDDLENRKRTLLHRAARDGFLDVVERLGQDFELLNVQDDWGNTPMHYAARYGQAEIVQWLLLHDADPSIVNHKNETPLHIAVEGGHASIVNIFTALADQKIINMGDQSGRTVLYRALEHLSEDENGRLLSDERKTEKISIIEMVLDFGANSNLADHNGVSPIYMAAYHGSIEATKLLLNHGANINVQTSGGETPLHAAVRFANCDLVNFLIEHGADQTVCDRYKNSPLGCAEKYVNVKPKSLDRRGPHLNCDLAGCSSYAKYQTIITLLKKAAGQVLSPKKNTPSISPFKYIVTVAYSLPVLPRINDGSLTASSSMPIGSLEQKPGINDAWTLVSTSKKKRHHKMHD